MELLGKENLFPGTCFSTDIACVSGFRILMPPPSVPIQMQESLSAMQSTTLLLSFEFSTVYEASKVPSRAKHRMPPL